MLDPYAEGVQVVHDTVETHTSSAGQQRKVRSDSMVLEVVLSHHYFRQLSFEACGIERAYGYYEGNYPSELSLLLGIRSVSRSINELILRSLCSSVRENGSRLIDFVVEVEKKSTGFGADRNRAMRSLLVRISSEPPPDKSKAAEELLDALWDRPTFHALRESSAWDPQYDRRALHDLLIGPTYFEWKQLRLMLRVRQAPVGEGMRELRAEGIHREVDRMTSMNSPACETALKALILTVTRHRGNDYSSLRWTASESSLYVEAVPPNLPRRAEEVRTKRWNIQIAGTDEWLIVETSESSFAKARH